MFTIILFQLLNNIAIKFLRFCCMELKLLEMCLAVIIATLFHTSVNNINEINSLYMLYKLVIQFCQREQYFKIFYIWRA